jgi:galactose mutarotase-like enzyme
MGGECVIGAEKENVVIKAGDCTVMLLPQFGGKIASICVRDQELLQAPLADLGPRTRTMVFDAGDASGWDECLPSVAACTVETAAGPAEIPDHGDLWREQWRRTGNREHKGREQGTGNRDQSISLLGKCFSLPLALERRLALTESAKGWNLQLDYKLNNFGKIAAPWSWAAHPLFAVEAGDSIELPESIASLRVEGSAGRLGAGVGLVAWPVAKGVKDSKSSSGGEVDLRVVQSRRSRIADKVFAGPLGTGENWCALHRRKAGLRIRVGFDPIATPYLGLWLCYGGWPERKGPKQMCVAMEPATAPVDSLAQTGEWSRVLGPGETFSWPMRVAIEIV